VPRWGLDVGRSLHRNCSRVEHVQDVSDDRAHCFHEGEEIGNRARPGEPPKSTIAPQMQSEVFPALDAYCAAKGYQFLPLDLRWGVNEEAHLDQRTRDGLRPASCRAAGVSPHNCRRILIAGTLNVNVACS
jgi:hypothetical protein